MWLTSSQLCEPVVSLSVLSFAWNNPSHVKWAWDDATVVNTVGSLVGMFLLYDVMYAPFHRFMHLPALYPLVHAHHHRQHAPSRGFNDTINVHFLEFAGASSIHVACVMLVPAHASAVLAFLVIGAVLATLNHTRFDLELFGGAYAVRTHDLHHRVPTVAFGQYFPFVDMAMGTYRAYTKPKEFKGE